MAHGDRLTVKVLPAHKAALERTARANGEAMAVVVRRLIRTEAERLGMWPEPGAQEAAHD